MAWQRFAVWTLAATFVAASASRGLAEGVKLGDPAPTWSGIPGIDGKKHSLADYGDAQVIALVFTCNHCPIAVMYEDRLVALQKDYKEKGVQVIAVNVNNLPADRMDKMKVRAEEKGFNFPYLYDASQKIGHDYGAEVTPHVFVLDKARKVVYIGAVDDNNNMGSVQKKFARQALDAVLAGQDVPAFNEKLIKARGCTIKYD